MITNISRDERKPIKQDLLYSYLYVSEFRLNESPACIPIIIRQSRVNNKLNHITGVLVFDGTHFCQYIEGLEPDVNNLVDKILKDPRHCNIKTCYSGVSQKQARHFDSWCMAYATIDICLNSKLSGLSGNQSLSSFLEIIPKLDIA